MNIVRTVSRELWALGQATLDNFMADKVPRLAASLAYYTLFSLAPLLVIIVAIAGFVFGPEAARGEIVGQIEGLVGRQGAEAVQSILERAYHPATGIAASIVGLLTLFLGATGAFAELQDALNTVWGVMPRPGRGLRDLLKVRLIAFMMVVSSGFVLIVSLVVSAALGAATRFIGGYLAWSAELAQGANTLASVAVFTLILGLIYKLVPDVEIAWRDVWAGAALTAALFTIGKFLIGLYLGRSTVTSTYGAAGSVVILLLWVYYSSMILFAGAEFTQVLAARSGRSIRPSRHAIAITDVLHVIPEPRHARDGAVLAAAKTQARKHVEEVAREEERRGAERKRGAGPRGDRPSDAPR